MKYKEEYIQELIPHNSVIVFGRYGKLLIVFIVSISSIYTL
jgi:hypothetical protein